MSSVCESCKSKPVPRKDIWLSSNEDVAKAPNSSLFWKMNLDIPSAV